MFTGTVRGGALQVSQGLAALTPQLDQLFHYSFCYHYSLFLQFVFWLGLASKDFRCEANGTLALFFEPDPMELLPGFLGSAFQ